MSGTLLLVLALASLAGVSIGLAFPVARKLEDRWFVFAGYNANGQRFDCRVGVKRGNGPDANPFPAEVFSAALGQGWETRSHAEWSTSRLNAN